VCARTVDGQYDDEGESDRRYRTPGQDQQCQYLG